MSTRRTSTRRMSSRRMSSRRTRLSLFLLALSLSACAGAYEEAREAAALSGVVLVEKTPQPKKSPGKKGRKGKAEKSKSETKKPEAVGACVTYQFLGGADCEEALAKRECYKRANVVDWRNGLTCLAAFLSPPPPAEP